MNSLMCLFLLGCNDKIIVAEVSDSAGQNTDNTANEPSDDTVIEDTSPSPEPSGEPSSEPSSEDTAAPPPPEPIVRFVALGDGGEGNDTQYAVASAMKSVCDSKSDSDGTGCQFALYLGDNFYDEGVENVYDSQFLTKFEDPYAVIDFPFYVALGNHDYGGCAFGSCGAGWEFDKADAQVMYTHFSDKWVMPSEFYHFTEGHADFFALDTNALMWDPWFSTGEAQYPWFVSTDATTTGTWKIAFGHHPYRSNGRHGNAGTYEGLDWLEWLGFVTDVPLGAGVRDFMEANLCNNIDLYLCGHDHNRQWLEPVCGMELMVTGAAAKTTGLEGRGNATFFEDDQNAGFVWIELRGNCLTGEFYTQDGVMDFGQQYCK